MDGKIPRRQYRYYRKLMHELDPRPNEDELDVHHIDGDYTNNDPSNLMWMDKKEHHHLHYYKGKDSTSPEYQKNYQREHLAEFREYNKKSYQAHKEEYRARHAKYRAEHIEEIRAHDRERYRLKKEKEAMAV